MVTPVTGDEPEKEQECVVLLDNDDDDDDTSPDHQNDTNQVSASVSSQAIDPLSFKVLFKLTLKKPLLFDLEERSSITGAFFVLLMLMFLCEAPIDSKNIRYLNYDKDYDDGDYNDMMKRVFNLQVVTAALYFPAAILAAGAIAYGVAQDPHIKRMILSIDNGREEEADVVRPTWCEGLRVSCRHFPALACVFAFKAAGIYGVLILFSTVSSVIRVHFEDWLRTILVIALGVVCATLLVTLLACLALVVPVIMEKRGLVTALQASLAHTWRKPRDMMCLQANILVVQQLLIVFLVFFGNRSVVGPPGFYRKLVCVAGVTSVGPGFVHM